MYMHTYELKKGNPKNKELNWLRIKVFRFRLILCYVAGVTNETIH